ncbi:protein FAR1-RELATED SEQUENCE 5-like [Apium graveolens]|uniref:protein FAR1-RELATED SEQUENCE 5-like n=1 Tax=Apium graveolens TaxID=4045 RepID=UPI003D7AB4FB
MRNTSRSESENSFFAQFHKQGDTLSEFWLRFESVMDRQRNEAARLDEESKSSVPTTFSTWFIEDDAARLFTRTVFYQVQEEIFASCVDMQIKRMSNEVDGVTCFDIKDVKVNDKLFKVSVSMNHAVCSCKKFVICGIVCRHSFCRLKHIRVTKFPKSLVLNRWMINAESGTSSNLDLVTSACFKLEQVSLKLTNIWFDFRQSVDKTRVNMDKLGHVPSTIKQLNTDLDDEDESVVAFTKKDHMAAMVGQQPSEEVTILAPNICKNKGNYFKRMMSDREKAVIKLKKRIRKCALCQATTHDARKCEKRKNAKAK